MKGALVIYLKIGAIFGAIMEMSYVWASRDILWHADSISKFLPFVLGALVAAFIALPSAMLRTIAWLPELILWVFYDNSYSFGEWLAPGFYGTFGATS